MKMQLIFLPGTKLIFYLPNEMQKSTVRVKSTEFSMWGKNFTKFFKCRSKCSGYNFGQDNFFRFYKVAKKIYFSKQEKKRYLSRGVVVLVKYMSFLFETNIQWPNKFTQDNLDKILKDLNQIIKINDPKIDVIQLTNSVSD